MTRRASELVLAGLAAVANLISRWSSRPVGIALVYHGLAPETDKNRQNLSPAQSADEFTAHVALAARRYHLVRGGELPAAVAARRRGQRIPVAITFDDDLRSHLDLAVPILRAADVPATFFLCGHTLDSPDWLWWQLFEAAHHRQPERTGDIIASFGLSPLLPEANVDALGRAVEAMTPHRRAEFVTALRAVVPGPPDDILGLRSKDVHRLASYGHEIGFHTREHPPLAYLADDDLADALRRGRDELVAAVQRPVTTIAYPHGAADERVARAARKAGWKVGFTVQAQAATATSDPLTIGRLEPWDFSPTRFAVAVAGLVLRAGR